MTIEQILDKIEHTLEQRKKQNETDTERAR
ncbi:MAG: hypothetical protein JWP13_509 [Candidatus Saccharibacteria bacterium]|nr:hypothetical protein [Candidatus Saccharibacteria bacterium]